ncbi:MAG: stage V sporulation protein AB [Lachnospiraceae bacterium]|nr:stage V sporulation protein AB [Lachnospiraceae bacterium]
MLIKEIILGICGLGFGMMVAAGVFTVLFVVGLIPRFASKTNTARCEILYEEFIIAGTMLGCVASVFDFPFALGDAIMQLPPALYDILTNVLLSAIGIFTGIFVGCLALAIAELLDSIPIFARRAKLHGGFEVIVAAIALGKLIGAIIYFAWEFAM